MSSKYLYYLRQLSKSHEKNHFLLPWGGLSLRNCDENGDILTFKNIKEYKPVENKFWLHLPLLLFRANASTYFFPSHFLILEYLPCFSGRTLPCFQMSCMSGNGVSVWIGVGPEQGQHCCVAVPPFQGCISLWRRLG